MKKKNIYINKGQYMAGIFGKIPANTVIKKNITGIGATTLEILAERNSIVILPNLPVIYLKEHAHADLNVLGVHSGITILDIIEYLSDTNVKYKKILTTPESFYKIITAFINQRINYRNEYFLLFDECDKISKDIDYRKTISLPMDIFFSFKNKAFISATAIIPEDPRFVQQEFEFINIIPNYEIKEDVKLYKCNNTLSTFSYLIKQDISQKNYFIFCNSLNMITHMINANNLANSSTIFCSETSAERLKGAKFNHISNKLDESKFSTYNFFTSRFFSALDIYFDKNIEVYIITDLGIAEYTMIDPATDAIQIIGRFRNKSITKNIKILFTEDTNLPSLDKEACLKLIDKYKFSYDEILKIGSTLNVGQYKSFIDELQSKFGYNFFLNRDNTVDYFKVDNFLLKNLLNYLFQSFENIIECYRSLKIENTDTHFFNIKYIENNQSEITSSSQKLLIAVGQKFSTIVREVITLLEELEPTSEFEVSAYNDFKNKLRVTYPDIVNGYDLIDRDLLKIIEKPRELEREIKRAIIASSQSNFDFINDLKVEFLIGEKLSLEEIISRFSDLINRHGLQIAPSKKQLENFIYLKRTQLIDGSWGYRVSGYMHK